MLDVESSDARQKTIGLFQFVVFVVTGIACLRWIHRASSNAHVLAGRALQFTPGWAVGWYFIPVLCLWKPFQAMSEIAQVSASAARRPLPDLGPWWTFWLIGNLSGSLAFNLQREAQEISTLMWGSAAWIASDLASLVADLCLIGIVKAISSMQLQGYDTRRMAPATGAAQPA